MQQLRELKPCYALARCYAVPPEHLASVAGPAPRGASSATTLLLAREAALRAAHGQRLDL